MGRGRGYNDKKEEGERRSRGDNGGESKRVKRGMEKTGERVKRVSLRKGKMH